ncbi:MAG: hypothetical protein ACI9NC_002794 [Verrucomicrobiales bacterium]|jgi:hypothetical protein
MPEPIDLLAKKVEALGIDLGLIDENLRLTPLERIRQHDRNVRQILAIQECLGVAHLSDDDS